MNKRNKLERYILRGQILIMIGPIFLVIFILLILRYLNIIDTIYIFIIGGSIGMFYIFFSIIFMLILYLYIIRKRGDYYIPDYYNIDYIIGCRIENIHFIKNDDIVHIVEYKYFNRLFHNQHLIKICLKKGIIFAEAPFRNRDLNNSLLIIIDESDYHLMKKHHNQKLIA